MLPKHVRMSRKFQGKLKHLFHFKAYFHLRNTFSTSCLTSFKYFFSFRVLFHGHWQLTGQQGMGENHLLFHSTTSTRSWTFRHLFAILHVRWLSHIFNRTACIYQAAARWDLPRYRITISLIDDVTLSFFVCLRDDLILAFFVTAIWDEKPVDLNSHRLTPLYYKRTD